MLRVRVRVREAITRSKPLVPMVVQAAPLQVELLLAHRVPARVRVVPAAPVVRVRLRVALAVLVVPADQEALAEVPVDLAVPAVPVVHRVAVRLLAAVVAVEAPLVRSVAPEESLHVRVSPSAPSGWSTRSSKLLPSAASRSLVVMAKR